VSRFVVDASVAAKWYFPEEHSEAALGVLHRDNELYAPDFLLAEVDAVAAKRLRRREITAGEAARVRAALRKVPLRYESFRVLLDPAFELSAATGSSLYDCLYLALALLRKAPLLTADQRFYRALRRGPFAGQVKWVGEG